MKDVFSGLREGFGGVRRKECESVTEGVGGCDGRCQGVMGWDCEGRGVRVLKNRGEGVKEWGVMGVQEGCEGVMERV